MERITKKIKKTIHGEFLPEIHIGHKVSVGDTLGTAQMPEILEEYELKKGTRLLVDEGIFVTEGQKLLEYSKGIYNETVVASHDGVVKIYNEKLMIIGGEKSEKITADLWGRVLLTSSEGYVIEAPFLKLPIFVSSGKYFEGKLLLVEGNGVSINPKMIKDNVEDKLVVLSGALTKETYNYLVDYDAAGIIASSIDWQDYEEIFRNGRISTGILQGFGRFPLWDWFAEFFKKINNLYIEVDFEHSFLYLPYSDIMFHSFPKDIYLFKDVLWGKKVKEVQQIENDLIAVLNSNEKTPVLEEELQKII